jgi:uncharacterized protein (DUF1015 family)
MGYISKTKAHGENIYMAVITPFKALRPQAQNARQVASKPYDVLNSKEAKVEAQGNPNSFLHVTKSEIDLPEGTDVHSQEVYEKAKENLQAFLQRDIVFQEGKPCYYIYQLVMDGRKQTGLVCTSSVQDYLTGVIKKHELTRPEKEQDRINHIKTTGAQTGNVFLAYRDIPGVNDLIDKWTTDKSPVYDFTADDQVRHTVWVVNDESVISRITQLFGDPSVCTYIADGHHRAASAAKVRAALGARATEASAYFLTTLFPAGELHIMDYNRVVRDLNQQDEAAFLVAVGKAFTMESSQGAVSPAGLHEFGMYLKGQWYRLTAPPGSFSTDPIGVLDVTILQDRLLEPILGIRDQRTDTRIDFVGGIRGLGELEARVNSGEMAVAFSLHPVTISQLFDIADSGAVMPPKSTWFEPKLRDGLLTHLIH